MKLLSLLPLQALYFLCYLLFILLFYVVKYRRDITYKNLKSSFPEKSEEEIRDIEKKYYKYLSRLTAEFIKGFTIGEKEIRKRVVIEDREVLERIYDEHNAAIVLLGHYGNWEMIALASELIAPHHFGIIYKPIHNKLFNYLMNKTRTKFGAEVIDMHDTYNAIKNLQNEKTLFTFVADQNPSNTKIAKWTNFLNQDTAFLSGAEIIGKRLKLPICYLSINISKSGYYTIKPKLLLEYNSENTEEDLISIYASELEKDIRKAPEFWLWSHRRWKHTRH